MDSQVDMYKAFLNAHNAEQAKLTVTPKQIPAEKDVEFSCTQFGIPFRSKELRERPKWPQTPKEGFQVSYIGSITCGMKCKMPERPNDGFVPPQLPGAPWPPISPAGGITPHPGLLPRSRSAGAVMSQRDGGNSSRSSSRSRRPESNRTGGPTVADMTCRWPCNTHMPRTGIPSTDFQFQVAVPVAGKFNIKAPFKDRNFQKTVRLDMGPGPLK